MGGRSLTAKYLDVYHVRDHKPAEHWHLALDSKADEAAFMVGRPPASPLLRHPAFVSTPASA